MDKHHIRIKRPSSRPVCRMQENDWDTRFWVSAMPKYNFRTTRVQERSFRTKSSNHSLAKSHDSSHSKRVTDKEVKEGLLSVWEAYEIPFQHRELFYKSMAHLSIKDANLKMAREIEGIARGTSIVSQLCERIKKREELLNENPGEVNKLRLVTLEVVEFIAAWRQIFGVAVDFQWNGVSYLEKLKKDTEKKRGGPFLLGQRTVKVHPATLARVNAVAKHLNLAPITPCPAAKRRLRRRKITREAETAAELPLEGSAREPKRSSKWVPSAEFTSEFSGEYTEALIVLHLNVLIPGLVEASYCEIILAALSLHSSAILDKCITEVLESLIPEVESEARLDMRSQEYTDIVERMLDEVCSSETSGVVKNLMCGVLSEHLWGIIVDSLGLTELVQEAVDEEIVQSQEIVYVMLGEVIEAFFKEEWVEELAEREVIQGHLDRNRLSLPSHIQRELFLSDTDAVYQRVAEEVYFQLLFDFVGGFWLERLVSAVYYQHTALSFEEIFILCDPQLDVEDIRKEAARKIQVSVYSRKH